MRTNLKKHFQNLILQAYYQYKNEQKNKKLLMSATIFLFKNVIIFTDVICSSADVIIIVFSEPVNIFHPLLIDKCMFSALYLCHNYCLNEYNLLTEVPNLLLLKN
ncbi:hypothetical protein PanWU01x14_078830 [Parasponia andersonii]|uniref:Uncharacterized protein n=1 Tax=Parasponia andersonii TaxID=3476 RepID=A0A2P5DC45_PARAD|nr:hypothetical protein PanWU01x14_078830 [Parasponia andersonii]